MKELKDLRNKMANKTEKAEPEWVKWLQVDKREDFTVRHGGKIPDKLIKEWSREAINSTANRQIVPLSPYVEAIIYACKYDDYFTSLSLKELDLLAKSEYQILHEGLYCSHMEIHYEFPEDREVNIMYNPLSIVPYCEITNKPCIGVSREKNIKWLLKRIEMHSQMELAVPIQSSNLIRDLESRCPSFHKEEK